MHGGEVQKDAANLIPASRIEKQFEGERPATVHHDQAPAPHSVQVFRRLRRPTCDLLHD